MGFSIKITELLRQVIRFDSSITSAGKEKLRSLIAEVEKTLYESERVEVLTYEAALKYFKTDAPKHQKATQGLLMRERTARGYHIFQIFLNAKDEIIADPRHHERPYGRHFTIGQLDQELEENFGGSDVIVVR